MVEMSVREKVAKMKIVVPGSKQKYSLGYHSADRIIATIEGTPYKCTIHPKLPYGGCSIAAEED